MSTFAKRLNDSKKYENFVAMQFEEFIRTNKIMQQILQRDLKKFNKHFSLSDISKIKITANNQTNPYDVDLVGTINDEVVCYNEVKTVIANHADPLQYKQPLVPITAESGKYEKNGLVKYYENSIAKGVPLYFIVFDEHSYYGKNLKEKGNYLYFYDARLTKYFVGIINYFFDFAEDAKQHPENYNIDKLNINNIISECNKKTCEEYKKPIDTVFRCWKSYNGTSISFLPRALDIEPTKTFPN